MSLYMKNEIVIDEKMVWMNRYYVWLSYKCDVQFFKDDYTFCWVYITLIWNYKNKSIITRIYLLIKRSLHAGNQNLLYDKFDL